MISVIIPIYNAEKYLNRCLESLANQTFQDIEILLIDDGSSDSSADICKEFARKNSAFRYLKKRNGGVSSARNYGLQNSNGDLIAFIDADDWVDAEYLNVMQYYIYNKNVDIVMCQREIVSNSTTSIKYYTDIPEGGISITNASEFEPTPNNMYGAVWGCLFKRDKFKGLLFDENIYFGEDMLYLVSAILLSSKVCRINLPIYKYWKELSEESLSKGEFSEKRVSNLKAYKEVIKMFTNNEKARNIMKGRYAEACSYFLNIYYNESNFMKNYYKGILFEYRKNYRYLSKIRKIALKDFVLFLFPDLTLSIKKTIKEIISR